MLGFDQLRECSPTGAVMRMKRRVWDTPATGVGLVVVLALIWELTPRLGFVHADAWPALSDVARVFVEPERASDLLREAGGSLTRMLKGFAIGSIAGVATGIAMAASRPAFSTLDLSLQLLRVIPIPALIPPAILFLGLDDAMKVTIVAPGRGISLFRASELPRCCLCSSSIGCQRCTRHRSSTARLAHPCRQHSQPFDGCSCTSFHQPTGWCSVSDCW